MFNLATLALAVGLANGAEVPPLVLNLEPHIQLAAVDDKLGFALMSAVVATDGTLGRNSGAASAAKTAGGTYTVQFDRDVTDCVYAASLGDISTGLPPVGTALVSRSGTDSATALGS
jgi:hypothetical protein